MYTLTHACAHTHNSVRALTHTRLQHEVRPQHTLALLFIGSMKFIYALESSQSARVHDYKYQRIKQKVTRKCSAHRQRLARPKNITSLFQIKSISKPIGCRAKPADDYAGNLQSNNPRIRCLHELEVRVLLEGRNTSWKVPLRQLKNIFKELNQSTQLLAGV